MFRCNYMLLLLFLLYTTAIAASPDVTPPDLNKGKALLKEHCYSCHGNDVYIREKRIVTSYPKLIKRVRFCSLQRNLTWFDDDIENVATYLNTEFYHFKD